MLRPAVIALKAIIVLGLLACMGAQTAMVLAAVNTFGESLQKLVTSTIVFLVLLAVEVAAFAIWQLLALIDETPTDFANASRPLATVMAAFMAIAVFLWIFGLTLAPTDVAPGIVLLIGILGLAALGVALLVDIQRHLLLRYSAE
ncbi:hypothetical protein [Corynebacterium doosanense]|uniref:ABC transporter n=1 Tax=Corynebacterium doosanense CAU 212 = DSM 45436 TaxID=558173 RepID=A0A097IFP5_9CORY|nr:hypothetical protein [Corynebacterium doosanense]AIT60935.1 ABC transporter [Corynebacterium doosanense CAU 212 = DSM 45436]